MKTKESFTPPDARLVRKFSLLGTIYRRIENAEEDTVDVFEIHVLDPWSSPSTRQLLIGGAAATASSSYELC
ncbi:hypothetical protein EYF80_059252 [Liparis tanakae]|uniref:Uncharacterized protein n=1 Tax=Liparis tanakae TaxID=230148 RepID=A0A4Z2EQE9_9TELE|nr:hypothetical protein EYF80_059252 [Liparis tanakae]